MPRLEAWAREQNRRDGTNYPLPKVFEQAADGSVMQVGGVPLALALVRDGRVVQGHVFERTVELTSYGTDPQATSDSMRQSDAVFWMLREMGYMDCHLLVPQTRVGQLEHEISALMGMKRIDERLAHFYRRLTKEG